MCHATLGTSAINTDATERVHVDPKPKRSSIRDGPSLKDFLGMSSNVDIPSQESIPYVPNIRGENQKGFLAVV